MTQPRFWAVYAVESKEAFTRLTLPLRHEPS
jgi:hypothetical protein